MVETSSFPAPFFYIFLDIFVLLILVFFDFLPLPFFSACRSLQQLPKMCSFLYVCAIYYFFFSVIESLFFFCIFYFFSGKIVAATYSKIYMLKYYFHSYLCRNFWLQDQQKYLIHSKRAPMRVSFISSKTCHLNQRLLILSSNSAVGMNWKCPLRMLYQSLALLIT